MLKPAVVTRGEKRIIGIETRTTNRAEGDPQTATIPALWQRYFQIREAIPKKLGMDKIFGAYTNYESDHNGEYSLIVGSEVSSLDEIPEGMAGLSIAPAWYLVFTAEGEMPAALIETWGRIWEHFAEDTEHQRAYTTDYELHDQSNSSHVEVYIAVK